MKRTTVKFFSIAGLVGSLLGAASAFAEPVRIEDVPPAVRTTIEKEAKGHELLELEREMEGGLPVYEAEWREQNRKVEIKVNDKGQVIERNHEAL
jgi:hypothetical protein